MTAISIAASLEKHERDYGRAALVTKDDDLQYDLGNMTAFDFHAVDIKALQQNPTDYLNSVSRDNVQLLLSHLHALPTEEDPDTAEKLVALPAAVTLLPREKPVPQPKKPTKWELFAKEMGIKKRKRDRMAFDETADEFKPRFGYGSKRNSEANSQWVVEDKPGVERSDPFNALKKVKKERIDKNEARMRRNLGIAPATKSSAKPSNAEKKKALRETFKKAAVSTASVGKFDRRIEGEEKIAPNAAKRAKKDAIIFAGERERNMKALDKVLGQSESSSRSRLDIEKAVRIIKSKGGR